MRAKGVKRKMPQGIGKRYQPLLKNTTPAHAYRARNNTTQSKVRGGAAALVFRFRIFMLPYAARNAKRKAKSSVSF